MSEAEMTTDHDVIRKWAEARDGRPASVRATGGRGKAGLLRIDFEPELAEGLEVISWDDFFAKFDQEKLGFPPAGKNCRRIGQSVPQVRRPVAPGAFSRGSAPASLDRRCRPRRRRSPPRRRSPRRGTAPRPAPPPRPAPARCFRCADASAIAAQRLGVADREPRPGQPLQHREGQRPRPRRQDRVADRAGRRRVADPLAGRERARHVVEAGRLDGPHPEPRRLRLERQRDPRRRARRRRSRPARRPRRRPPPRACSAISSPTVPCPAITSGWSKGGISVSPRSAASRAPSASRSVVARS